MLRANAVLLTGLLLFAGFFGEELRWSWRELQRYREGRIGVPVERTLYLQARALMEEGGDREEIRGLLEASIRIDPYGEAVYWLGRSYVATGEDERALELLRRYLEIDPTLLETHLLVARIEQRLGREAEARAVLERGVAFFADRAARYRPQPDAEAGDESNRKAVLLQVRYTRAARALGSELERLQREPERAPGAMDGRG